MDILRLEHTATHCNTLQPTAKHCNTMQKTDGHTQAQVGNWRLLLPVKEIQELLAFLVGTDKAPTWMLQSAFYYSECIYICIYIG